MIGDWVINTLEKKYTLQILWVLEVWYLEGHMSMNVLELADAINGDYKTILNRIKEMEQVGLISVCRSDVFNQLRVSNTILGKRVICHLREALNITPGEW